MTIIDKTFDPAEIEARLYAHWEASGAFRPERPDAQPFTIVIPPPNVTGSLHIGHALDNTLQDVLIRYHRLKGRDALWVVGTDHAGIATQMVVERAIASQGLKRIEMGREAFLANVWEWKATSGSTITRQLRRLGASCDWAHERFTMDEGFSKAVTKVFVDLHREGLLYRAKRLVNWDPKLKTAISDLEVEPREVQGSFTHIRYPLADGSESLVVATTRPETMLGDTAVAVNPKDERYAAMVGKQIAHPLTGRLIPVIADNWADPELGSGAVKITPAHDFNDWQVYERHKAIGWINILDAEANIVAAQGVPDKYVGLTREAARDAIVADLDALGLVVSVEAKTIQMPYGDRSGVVIEPWLTDQWYVDAATLAGPALNAVRDGRTQFVPRTWEKTYFNWMENIQPWCVSRQLWWGHRIPAWYGPPVITLPDGTRVIAYFNDELFRRKADRPEDSCFFVALNEIEMIETARRYYTSDANPNPEIVLVADRTQAEAIGGGNTIALFQDPDVLDTWFSSALWPFGTLGWPDAAAPAVIPAQARTQSSSKNSGAADDNSLRSGLGPRLRGDDERKSGDDERKSGNGGTMLARHYPGDVLVTGFDIIFFWVARMMMQGLHFMGEVPFRTVYCHGLVRDASGAKMSKSKGNTIDPLVLIDRYGADALRLTLTAMETQGRDIKLDERRVEGYRNFATKLWNAARFCQSNGIGASASIAAPPATHAVNRWIVGEVAKTTAALDAAIAAFRFDDYAETAYQFVWSRFCDWYLELTKPLLAEGADAAVAAETRAVAGWALDQILVLLHPVMPFITEELWHKLGDRPYDLILAQWPDSPPRHAGERQHPASGATREQPLDPEVDAGVRQHDGTGEEDDPAAEIDWLIGLVSAIRSARTEVNVPPGAKLIFTVADADAATLARLETHAPSLAWLARVSAGAATGGGVQVIHGGATYTLPLEGVIDLAAERARLEKNALAAEKDRDGLAGRLASPGFVERAKPEAVDKARADMAARGAEAERLRAALERLG